MCDYRKFAVIVEGEEKGSGCIIQAMSDEYDYLLTAKHILNNCDINKIKITGHWLDIESNIKNIDIILHEKIKYEHENPEIDAIVLKIDKKFLSAPLYKSEIKSNQTLKLCGYPDTRSSDDDKYKQVDIKIENSKANGYYEAEILSSISYNKPEVIGFSGSGIYQQIDGNITLVGIQSKMATKDENEMHSRIDIMPISFFDDIINHSDYAGKLSPLFPPYMGSFEFLKDEILKLEGCINDDFILTVRTKLQLKADEVQLTPIDVINSYKDQLLINNENKSSLNSKKLWTSWLEYIIVLHIVKQKVIDNKDLSVIFNEIRLIHSETNKDWKRIMPDIFETDLYGLDDQGVLIVSTNAKPSTNIIEGEELINNIANANLGVSFKTDNAEIHPLRQFKFMHINAFEKLCIEDNESELIKYTGIDIGNLIPKLKEIFDEIL